MDKLDELLEKERKLSEALWIALDYAIICIRKGAERNNDEKLRATHSFLKNFTKEPMEEMERRDGR